MPDRSLSDDRVPVAVLALTALALVARFALLGHRIMHFDEARVAYWVYNYAETGQFHYRSIIHGPFIQHADAALFGLFGYSDFIARLPVAVVGGLLPLCALWLRHRLTGGETVALAFFLAANPVLLYFGRFMRSTLLVAGFCLLAFVAFVRWYDGFGVEYLYVGSGALALGFASKENALVYVLCWLGAGALVVHHKVAAHRGYDSGTAWVADRLFGLRSWLQQTWGPRLAGHVGHLVGAALVFVAVMVFFFAPRGGVTAAGDLAITPANPNYDAVVEQCRTAGLYSSSPGTTLRCTWLTVQEGFGSWLSKSGGSDPRTLVAVAGQLELSMQVIVGYAGSLFLLALVGFVRERYGGGRPRLLVLACLYWGLVSIPGYAIGTDINNAWIVVNALVPLAIPAAVGAGLFIDAGRDALERDDDTSLAIVGVVALVLLASVGTGVATGVYTDATEPDNSLVQFAQPSQDMRPAVSAALESAARTEGTDLLAYSGGNSNFVDGAESAPREPACLGWFSTLPLGWYLSAHDVATDCASQPGELPDELPSVVVVPGDCTLERTVDCRENDSAMVPPEDIEPRLDGYERYPFLHRSTGGNDFDGMIVYVDNRNA
ncbi:flippase activity-associated protein Agl23 [Halosegnis longus]|uniref:TIGR03663 family protein n=1 Tax=Halosegnis longus TaxID=2216012 RepID=A0AAJ4UWA7_9EURY|nr:flippase activity-associated protein Agl23 [Halosegnis longus]RNJ26888.1 TIGR03663 family protein [Salella cibi]